MKINFNDVITEQDGVDIFQVFSSHVDQPELFKQDVQAAYAVHQQRPHSAGMHKFYDLFLHNPNALLTENSGKMWQLAYDAVLKDK